jgi:hypothetical protein
VWLSANERALTDYSTGNGIYLRGCTSGSDHVAVLSDYTNEPAKFSMMDTTVSSYTAPSIWTSNGLSVRRVMKMMMWGIRDVCVCVFGVLGRW